MEFPDIKKFPKDVLVTSMLIDLTKETIPVTVVNITVKSRFVKEGQVLVTCMPVTRVKKNPQVTSNKLSKNLGMDLLKMNELNEQRGVAKRILIERSVFLYVCLMILSSRCTIFSSGLQLWSSGLVRKYS